MPPWIVEELRTVHLPDRRLEQRLALLLERLSSQPGASFPLACKGPAELEAAYRFFDNPRTSLDNLLAPHRDATLARIRQHPVVLLVQDTTELDLTRPSEVVGGPLNNDRRSGLFVHPLLAFTPERRPLGTVAVKVWARERATPTVSAAARAKRRKQVPISQKESQRWLAGYEQACAVAAACPDTLVVCLSDSEGDIYDVLSAAQPSADQPHKAHYVIRACQDRRRATPAQEADSDLEASAERKLFAAVAATPVRATRTIHVRRRVALASETRTRKQGRDERTATVTLRAAQVVLQGPQRPGGRLPDLTVQAVLVREEQPPVGGVAVEWLLLTDLPIDTVAQVETVVSCYGVRWQAEVFFRVLKGGCQLEQRQLETVARFEACLAVYLIVAWRVLLVTMQGRQEPTVSCAMLFETAEWQAAYTLVRGSAPTQAPPLGDMLLVVAELGGYRRRAKGGGPPGAKVIWRGLQRLRDLVACWWAFGPHRQPQLAAATR